VRALEIIFMVIALAIFTTYLYVTTPHISTTQHLQTTQRVVNYLLVHAPRDKLLNTTWVLKQLQKVVGPKIVYVEVRVLKLGNCTEVVNSRRLVLQSNVTEVYPLKFIVPTRGGVVLYVIGIALK